ncbi:MAG: methyl-accepting chemotaxis protein [Bryobacteraceae bacterium]
MSLESAHAELDQHRLWMGKIADICERIANGDLEARLIGVPAEPTIHTAVVAINRMLDQADAFVREARVSLDCASKGRFHRRFLLRGMKGSFRTGAQMINQATLEMEHQAHALQAAEQERLAMADELESSVRNVVEKVSQTAQHINQTAQSLVTAADRTTRDATEVARASARTSSSVSNVAASTDQLAVAFGEIEQQANDSARVANAAVSSAGKMNTVIQQLDEASSKIGGVVRIISQIARQTNLLALNATIEAARSGEAGRGFAVVASEVKHLAQQTAAATEEIETEVGSIQTAAGQTASSISGITGTIHSVDDIAKMIAMAVNSQREATTEISKSVQEAAQSTQSVSLSIEGVSLAASQTSENAIALLQPAEELKLLALTLGTSIDQFLATIRAQHTHTRNSAP